MKRLIYILFFSLSLFLFACGEEKKTMKKIDPIPADTTQLIRWHLLNDRALHNVSFPVWFNTERVQQIGLDTLTVTFYRYREKANERVQKDTFPDEMWQFSFSEEGWVDKLLLSEYNEGIHIADHTFDYAKAPDSNGYCAPTVSTQYLFTSNQNQLQGILNQVEDLKVFNRLIADGSDSVSIQYKNVLSRPTEKHIFIQDSANWNVTFIDHHFEAAGKNYFYFGIPNDYKQCFKLDNLVEKELLQVNRYYPNGVAKSQDLYKGEFYRRRVFGYDKNGQCTYFTDSIFSSGDQYVYREDVSITYSNDDNLPKDLVICASNDTAQVDPKKRYLFNYAIENKE